MTANSFPNANSGTDIRLFDTEQGRLMIALGVSFIIALALTLFGSEVGLSGPTSLLVMGAAFVAVAFVVSRFTTGSTAVSAEQALSVAELSNLRNSQAVIEFHPDGTIITANDIFCQAVGYRLEDIAGRHHSMFVAEADKVTPEYQSFWDRLARGETFNGDFRRVKKNGQSLYLRASYNPVRDQNGRIVKVVKYALDITDEIEEQALSTSELKALRETQAVIEFDPTGKIITANSLFCQTIGYGLDEIVGQHHRMFVLSEERASEEYTEFWDRLGRGEAFDGSFARRHKNGSTVYLRASYNPIRDNQGRVLKVVKYAADITDATETEYAREIEASENERIRQALDMVTANVMVGDADMNIVYVNNSMIEMFSHAENDLRSEFRSFDAENLVGQNVDIFHKNPKHQRQMMDALTSTHRTEITVAGRIFTLIANPVHDADGTRIGTVVEWGDITAERARENAEHERAADMAREAAENARIRQALDMVTANVMVGDADMNIVYVNNSMVDMFSRAEADLKTEFRAFNANALVGQNVDIFHKNPSHQRQMMEALTTTHRTEISVAGRIFTLIANPVHDADGTRIGSVVEWGDVTAERAIEREMKGVVDAAVAGDFTQRVELDGKDGFMLAMAMGVNTFAETTQDGIMRIADMLKLIAAGDLTAKIDEDMEGLFGELKDYSNETANKLSQVMSNIMQTSSEVANASTEIAAGSADLSQRTEEQASSLEETAAAMEQMSTAVKTTSSNANEANSKGQTARGVAETGGEVVNRAVEAMSRIEDSSQKISDIIGVIDEIAFQTNLLALNAAVEAARAGEAGKGFAVVASEVRALAQRSGEAAKDIKSLIVDSNQQVKDGVGLVNEAGQQLNEIVQSIQTVTNLVSEIASASQEQSTGIEEINRAITEMDEMTQQNSALVEETAASARSLQETVDVVSEEMSFFKVEGGLEPARRKRSHASNGKSNGAAHDHIPAIAAVPVSALDDDDWAEF